MLKCFGWLGSDALELIWCVEGPEDRYKLCRVVGNRFVHMRSMDTPWMIPIKKKLKKHPSISYYFLLFSLPIGVRFCCFAVSLHLCFPYFPGLLLHAPIHSHTVEIIAPSIKTYVEKMVDSGRDLKFVLCLHVSLLTRRGSSMPIHHTHEENKGINSLILGGHRALAGVPLAGTLVSELQSP